MQPPTWRTAFIPIIFCALIEAVAAELSWKIQRDDLTEYRVLEVKNAVNDRHCVMAADNADAVRFDPASGSCSLLACNRGTTGCRKCRHTSNSSQPLLWMKEPVKCWKTFQHRVDGSVGFNRTWSEYANGFGQGENLNYWMGLEQLHQITATGVWRVRWEFSDWNGTWYWAENAPFSVGSAAVNYTASMGSRDASRSNVGQETHPSWSPNNHQFSTPESDNDAFPSANCALKRSAGWWYGHCAFMNPNGVYKEFPNVHSGRGIYYWIQNSDPVFAVSYSMKTFECLIGN